MKLKKSAFLALSLLLLSGCGKVDLPPVTNTAFNSSTTASTSVKVYTFPGVLSAEEIQNKQIRITTAKGDIVFELYPDTAPLAVSNLSI